MFYRFNSVVGRLAPATQHAAYVPQGLRAVVKESPPAVFDSSRTFAAAAPEFPSKLSQSANIGEAKGLRPSDPVYMSKIVRIQNQWSKDHNLVWQKKTSDQLSFAITAAVIGLGFGLCFLNIWKMSWPKKTE